MGSAPLKFATFDEIGEDKKTLDLQEFLLFCKQFEIPLGSKVQLLVYRKIVEKSPTGKFSCAEFKVSL